MERTFKNLLINLQNKRLRALVMILVWKYVTLVNLELFFQNYETRL